MEEFMKSKLLDFNVSKFSFMVVGKREITKNIE